jgi:site-specific recombinase XerD
MADLVPQSSAALSHPPILSPLDHNPAAVYLARLTSTKSRRTQKGALEAIARLVSGGQQGILEFGWAGLRYQHTAAIRSKLAGSYAPSTANRMISALRGVLEEAWQLGLINADEYHRAAKIKNIKAETLPTGRALAKSEIDALVGTCKSTAPIDIRDAAILGVLRSGPRRFEVAGLDLADWDLTEGSLKIVGKGRKERTIYLLDWAIAALQSWLVIRGAEPGSLFHPINKGGKITPKRLSDEAIRTILLKRAESAGVVDISPHDWRRTFASDLLDSGADIVTTQKLLGHADPKTTARYDRRGEATKKRAVRNLNA